MSTDTVGRPMEILFIEDSLTEARLTIEVLEKAQFKHRLTWLRDGNEALEFLYRRGKYARAPRPDLVLLDLGLPKTDGRDVLVQLKSDAKLKQIPVVIMTVSNAEEDIAKSKTLHVEAYMTKPINSTKFMRLVTDLSRYWHEDMIRPTSS